MSEFDLFILNDFFIHNIFFLLFASQEVISQKPENVLSEASYKVIDLFHI